GDPGRRIVGRSAGRSGGRDRGRRPGGAAAGRRMNAVSALRRFVREKPPAVERCELCAAPVGPRHEHVVDPARHEMKCACTACALLFPDGARLLRVRPRAELLADFQLSDAQWDALRLPIGLAFFLRTASRVTAFYPGPAGPAGSRVSPQAPAEIARPNAPVVQPQG